VDESKGEPGLKAMELGGGRGAHRKGGGLIEFQAGTLEFGFRDQEGNFRKPSWENLKERGKFL